MKWFTILCVSLIGIPLTVLSGCSKDQAASTGPKPSYFDDNKETVTATVEAIDQASRVVTLRGQNGAAITFTVDDAVRNLDRVKVGDRVAIDYYQSVAMNVLPPGESVNEIKTAADRTSENPSARKATHTTVTATVEAVSKKTSEVTLHGQAGNRTIKVRDPKMLENVKVGDRVMIIYTESLAVGVRPAPQPAPAPATPPAPSTPAPAAP